MSAKKPQADPQNPPLPFCSRLLTPAEVAAALGVSETTLAVWRCRRRYHLPYIKCGSRVMYREEAVEQFIEERTRGIPDADDPDSTGRRR